MKKIALIMSMLIMVVSIASCGLLECKHNSITPATCTEGEKCNDCGEIFGEAKGHNWEAPTCTTPKTCSVCDETEGTAKGHYWKTATCTTPKTCIVCDETEGSVISHYYQNGYCEYCYSKDPYYLDVKNNDILTIEELDFYINSVGGVEVDIEFKNRSKKQIAYIYFTLKFYDRMGNAAYCEIQRTSTQRLQYTGPVNANSRETGYWDPLIYNSTTAAVKPVSIEIEYSDGTEITITCSGRYWYSGDFYGGSLKD